MQAVAVVILLFAQGELFQYDLSVDPVYLEELYANPASGISYPAMLSCPSGETSCMVRFRGNTTLSLPKKNWMIELDDPYIIGRSRLILDAHYHDLSMMRNCLAMMTTDLLGFPAPFTRHVRLSVNGEYYGVYLETERVDADFLNRVGLEEGVLFKAIGHSARFCWMPSGNWLDLCFKPYLDSDPFMIDINRFINMINTDSELPAMNTEIFLAYYAATLAVADIDSPSKNFFLYKASDDIWRIFPWDRDASFGNDWAGNHYPEIVSWDHWELLLKTALFPRLLENPQNREFFISCLDSIAVLMATELPEKLDSIYLSIRDDVYIDPLRQGTPGDFDNSCEELATFIQSRPQYLQSLGSRYQPVSVKSLIIDPVYIDTATDSVRVTVQTSRQLQSCILEFSIDSNKTRETEMQPVPGSSEDCWIGAVSALELSSSVVFCTRMIPTQEMSPGIPFYYPRYGFLDFLEIPFAYPGALRSDYGIIPSVLSVRSPNRFGSDLWAIPLVNASGSVQDMSLCAVSTGKPPCRIFFPESTLVQPWDTLFITNNARNLSIEYPSRQCFGDCPVSSPVGTRFLLMDPSWQIVLETIVQQEDTTGLENRVPLVSEICYDSPIDMDSGDWIELYNPYGTVMDLGGCILTDETGNMSLLPWGTVLEPAELMVIAHDPSRFRMIHPGVNTQATLEFGLSADGDVITMLDRSGIPAFVLEYDDNPPWPDASGRILALLSPYFSPELPGSWEAVDAPGTPGSLNPSWENCFNEGDITIVSLWPNPVDSAVSFEYTSSGAAVTGNIFDLSGRIVQKLESLPPVSSSVEILLDGPLSSGVYFLVLDSGGGMDTRRFVCLR